MPSRLLGHSDRDLRMIAGEATHQHFKGGLYRLVGTVCDADTGRPIKGRDGAARVLYEHLAPFERQFWMRDHTDFFGQVEAPDGSGLVPRFRKLG